MTGMPKNLITSGDLWIINYLVSHSLLRPASQRELNVNSMKFRPFYFCTQTCLECFQEINPDNLKFRLHGGKSTNETKMLNT